MNQSEIMETLKDSRSNLKNNLLSDRCGKIIKTYDNTPKPCLRKKGHTPGCNPFSDSYPGEEEEKKESNTEGITCPQCGTIMKRSGSCYACPDCGTTTGCS